MEHPVYARQETNVLKMARNEAAQIWAVSLAFLLTEPDFSLTLTDIIRGFLEIYVAQSVPGIFCFCFCETDLFRDKNKRAKYIFL